MDPKERYVLVPPVPGGNAWWDITDRELDFEVVSISIRVPNAEQIARSIFQTLTQEK